MPKVSDLRFEVGLPEGVSASIEGDAVTVTGPKGQLVRDFRHPRIVKAVAMKLADDAIEATPSSCGPIVQKSIRRTSTSCAERGIRGRRSTSPDRSMRAFAARSPSGRRPPSCWPPIASAKKPAGSSSAGSPTST